MYDRTDVSMESPVLDEQEQLLVENFRSIGGRPIQERSRLCTARPTPELRQAVSRQFKPDMLQHPLVAEINRPVTDSADDRRYFCAACAVRMPARERDWRLHTEGLSHQCQVLSLFYKGELGHVPDKHSGAAMQSSTLLNTTWLCNYQRLEDPRHFCRVTRSRSHIDQRSTTSFYMP